MHASLNNLPVFDSATFKADIAPWKKIVAGAKPGGDRILVEWGVSRGPNCFVYPAGTRASGISLTKNTPHIHSDERWADFLEDEFIPHVVRALNEDGFKPTVVCADLRPVQVMRARRRATEALARVKTGLLPHGV